VFAVAGGAKVMDHRGARQAVRAFGVPDSLATPISTLLPVAELAVAAALLVTRTAVGGAAGALVLLSGFVVGIAVSLAKGRQPDCRCFGQIHSAPVGAKTIVRNLALGAGAALVVVAGPGTGLSTWSEGLTKLEWLTFLAALVLVVAFAREGSPLVTRWQRSRQLASPIPPPEVIVIGSSGAGPPVGSKAPDFSLPGRDGTRLTLQMLRASGQPVVLVFADPGCGSCATLLAELGRWQADHIARLTIAVVSRGQGAAPGLQARGIVNIGVQTGREVAQAYRVGGAPSAVLIGVDGVVASPVAVGVDAIRELVRAAVRPGVDHV
jgi:hypothetical protein